MRQFISNSLCALGLLISTTSSVLAEHRVALLIGNGDYEAESLATDTTKLRQVAAALEKYGVRCKVLENLPGDKLKQAIKSFARSTPTRGTAIVYFRGHVLPGNYKGHTSDFITGTDVEPDNERRVGYTGFAIDTLLDEMRGHGGSSMNIALVDSSEKRDSSSLQLPAESMLAYVDSDALIEKISGNGELLAEIRAASRAHDSTLGADALLTGKGSTVVGPPDKFVLGNKAGDEWVNARGMVFCWCPPGRYTMGSPADELHRYPDEKQREVDIRDGFWISKYEMTLGQNVRNHPRETTATHKNHPLTMIHHDDGRNMTLRTITGEEQEKRLLPEDWQYSMPTEEQWEYAARAGTGSRYYFGDDMNALPQHANFADKSYYDSQDIYSNYARRTLDDGAVKLAIVGSYEPNPWGLHDAHGNVAEWCINTAIRGGSWATVPEHCRSAYRDAFSSRNEQNFIGYRLVIQKTPANQEN